MNRREVITLFGGAAACRSRRARSGLGRFGADTTLGFSADLTHTGGLLAASDGVHTQTITLLSQYAAADFAIANDGQGGTLVTDPSLTGSS